MVNHATSTLDLTNQQEAARVLPKTPLVASYQTGWKGLTFTHYCHPQFSIDDPVIQQLALALKMEIKTGCMSGRLYGELLGTALAARLVQNYAVSKPSLEFKANGLPQSQLERVIDYMKANLTQDLSILDLATLTSMSESHFSRSFKRSVGIAPYQYLMQQRVERAKQLLEKQSIAISTIALDCGFANQTHLKKVFRQMTGMTPKAYQK